jgi:hypothetical protein
MKMSSVECCAGVRCCAVLTYSICWDTYPPYLDHWTSERSDFQWTHRQHIRGICLVHLSCHSLLQMTSMMMSLSLCRRHHHRPIPYGISAGICTPTGPGSCHIAFEASALRHSKLPSDVAEFGTVYIFDHTCSTIGNVLWQRDNPLKVRGLADYDLASTLLYKVVIHEAFADDDQASLSFSSRRRGHQLYERRGSVLH